MCAHSNVLLTSLTIIYAYVNGGNTHYRKYLRVINMSHHTRDFFFPNTHARTRAHMHAQCQQQRITTKQLLPLIRIVISFSHIGSWMCVGVLKYVLLHRVHGIIFYS